MATTSRPLDFIGLNSSPRWTESRALPTQCGRVPFDLMKKVGDSFALSATDLVGYLNCHHLVRLDRAVAEGALSKPKVWDPLLQILSERDHDRRHRADASHPQGTVGLGRLGVQGRAAPAVWNAVLGASSLHGVEGSVCS